jgi:hypothetical protein
MMMNAFPEFPGVHIYCFQKHGELGYKAQGFTDGDPVPQGMKHRAEHYSRTADLIRMAETFGKVLYEQVAFFCVFIEVNSHKIPRFKLVKNAAIFNTTIEPKNLNIQRLQDRPFLQAPQYFREN